MPIPPSVEMVVINPKMIMVVTRAEKGVWEASLAKTWNDNPCETGEKLRHRPSKNLSPFAQIQATTAQIAAAKARRGHSADAIDPNKPKTLQATLSIPTQSSLLVSTVAVTTVTNTKSVKWILRS